MIPLDLFAVESAEVFKGKAFQLAAVGTWQRLGHAAGHYKMSHPNPSTTRQKAEKHQENARQKPQKATGSRRKGGFASYIPHFAGHKMPFHTELGPWITPSTLYETTLPTPKRQNSPGPTTVHNFILGHGDFVEGSLVFLNFPHVSRPFNYPSSKLGLKSRKELKLNSLTNLSPFILLTAALQPFFRNRRSSKLPCVAYMFSNNKQNKAKYIFKIPSTLFDGVSWHVRFFFGGVPLKARGNLGGYFLKAGGWAINSLPRVYSRVYTL